MDKSDRRELEEFAYKTAIEELLGKIDILSEEDEDYIEGLKYYVFSHAMKKCVYVAAFKDFETNELDVDDTQTVEACCLPVAICKLNEPVKLEYQVEHEGS